MIADTLHYLTEVEQLAERMCELLAPGRMDGNDKYIAAERSGLIVVIMSEELYEEKFSGQPPSNRSLDAEHILSNLRDIRIEIENLEGDVEDLIP